MFRDIRAGGQEIDPLQALMAEARVNEGRPWVMYNMVESVDGGTAVHGGASGLNDEDDRFLFLALRVAADVVMAGASTIRAEHYGPMRLNEERRRLRANAGMSETPTLVIPTRSLDLDPDARVFSDPEYRPTIITGIGGDPDRLEALAAVANIIETDDLSGRGIISALGDVGVVLCEGGPKINSTLMADGMVDEIDLTISPMLALGESQRIAHGAPLEPPIEMKVDRMWSGDRSLFLRYVRA